MFECTQASALHFSFSTWVTNEEARRWSHLFGFCQNFQNEDFCRTLSIEQSTYSMCYTYWSCWQLDIVLMMMVLQQLNNMACEYEHDALHYVCGVLHHHNVCTHTAAWRVPYYLLRPTISWLLLGSNPFSSSGCVVMGRVIPVTSFWLPTSWEVSHWAAPITYTYMYVEVIRLLQILQTMIPAYAIAEILQDILLTLQKPASWKIVVPHCRRVATCYISEEGLLWGMLI